MTFGNKLTNVIFIRETRAELLMLQPLTEIDLSLREDLPYFPSNGLALLDPLSTGERERVGDSSLNLRLAGRGDGDLE